MGGCGVYSSFLWTRYKANASSRNNNTGIQPALWQARAWKVSILLWAVHRHLFIFQGPLIDQSIGTIFQLQG